MFRIVVDVTTGEAVQIPLTADELAEIAARPPEPVPPATCTPWQIRKALNQMDLRAAVEAAVSASPDQEIRDGWSFATEFRSDDPFVLSMGAALGKTADETRDLIAFASTL